MKGKAMKFDRGRLQSAYHELRPAYDRALEQLCASVWDLFERHDISPTIKYRVKRFGSYYERIKGNVREERGRRGAITDMLGIRIICPFMEDVDRVEQMLASHFNVVETERKSAGHTFREFGYDSVHLLISVTKDLLPRALPGTKQVCEIQLRTTLQDAWAEVEHELVYKSDIDLPNLSIRRKLASLNASLTLSDLIFQEIRDYQKNLRLKALKRRESFENPLEFSANVTISGRPPPDPLEMPPKPTVALPPLGGTRLERAMLEALSAHSNGEYAEAIRTYGAILRMKLDHSLRSLVYNHRGMAHFSLSEYQKSIKDFSRAIEFDPDNVRAYCNRGLVYRVTGKLDRSLADYDTAIQVAPTDVDGWWGRAQTSFELKLFTRAIEDCRRVLALSAGHAQASALLKAIHRSIF